MITKLTLKSFKNFKDAEILFGPLSVLIGVNASGKSNVRDALRFLHGIARGYTLAEIIGEKYGEGGQLQWSGIRGGTREICYAGGSQFTIGIQITSEKQPESANHSNYYYEISVEVRGAAGPPIVVAEQLLEDEKVIFKSLPNPESHYNDWDFQILASVGKPKTWKNGSDLIPAWSNQPMLTQILKFGELEQIEQKLKAAVQGMLVELESMRFIDFEPELMRKPSTPGQIILSDRGENLSSVLQAICEKPELKDALSKWLQELTPMDVADFDFVPDAAGKVLVYLVEEGGQKISANSASDGTLRFLGVLAALLGPKPARFFFLEEIDNGIHPARLALLMDLLETRSAGNGIQIAITTHSPQGLRLIKGKNLEFATLAYRIKGTSDGRLKSLPKIPHLMDAIQRQDIARLHESSWMENTMEFTEGTPSIFPLEEIEERAK